jgi:hypothetical protein
MKAFALLLTLGFLGTAIAQQCPGSWYLEPDDCICMNSRDGSLLKTQTLGCCKSMGYKTYDNVSVPHQGRAATPADEYGTPQICAVDHNKRQAFKDCCKGLNQESVIGHCR